MKQNDLIQIIFGYVCCNGVTSAIKTGGWEYTYGYNGMVITCKSIDEGYTDIIIVKDFLHVMVTNSDTPEEKVTYWTGSENSLLTIARMLGLSFNGKLV